MAIVVAVFLAVAVYGLVEKGVDMGGESLVDGLLGEAKDDEGNYEFEEAENPREFDTKGTKLGPKRWRA